MRGAAEVDKNSCRKPYEVRRKDPKRTLKIILREADTKLLGNGSYDTVFSHMQANYQTQAKSEHHESDISPITAQQNSKISYRVKQSKTHGLDCISSLIVGVLFQYYSFLS